MLPTKLNIPPLSPTISFGEVSVTTTQPRAPNPLGKL
jgi:hypothetical protein